MTWFRPASRETLLPELDSYDRGPGDIMKIIVHIVTALLLLAASVAAHPLGNFSINQFSRIEVGERQIRIAQVLDMAEIPTFQAASIIDTNKDGTLSDTEMAVYANAILPEYLGKLSLTVNDLPVPISPGEVTAAAQAGAGGLQTLRIKWSFTADVATTKKADRIVFRNENYAERLGWREMVVNGAQGVAVFDSTAFGNSASEELTSYPAESLALPLNERSAEFSSALGVVPEGNRPLQNRDGHLTPQKQKDRLAELIAVPEITPVIAILGLLVAFALGAFHAMSPGHGKAVVGAYLVGSRGTPKHAAFLGLTVTITHTLGVFALGVLTLFASNYILPEKIMPFLAFFSGLIVLYIGLTMFKTRLFAALGLGGNGGHSHHHASHTHSHGTEPGHHHDHGTEGHSHSADLFTHTHDGHTHSHVPPEAITWKSLLALGVSGGLLPCPSALVLMLSAINLNRVGYGLVLTLAFSVGLAATLTAVGLLFLYGGRIFNGTKLQHNPVMKALPVCSAFVIACLGAWICYSSLG